MKRFTFLAVLALAFSSQAATHTDSVLTLSGGRQVVFTWMRNAWCNANYVPIAAQASDPSKYRQIMVYNTANGGSTLCLDSTVGWKNPPFINRKDGKYVYYNGMSGSSQVAYVINADGNNKRNLNLGAENQLVCTQYNPATGEEFIYVLGNQTGTGANIAFQTVYRIKLKADYSADLTTKTQVIFQSEFDGGNYGIGVDGAFSVSADGTKAGCALPWPNTRIIDIPSKTVYVRHQGMFGCNSNIAPDNSYRFMHFGDDHDLVHMWTSNLVDTWWDVKFAGVVPLSLGTFQAPRFTSNVNFMTLQGPEDPGDEYSTENNIQYTWGADKVKGMPVNTIPHCYLGKFSTDFKSVSWLVLNGTDSRISEGAGMAYVSELPVKVNNEIARVSNATIQPIVALSGNRLSVAAPDAGIVTVTLVNTSGQIVAHASGNGKVSCALKGRLIGSFVAHVTTGSGEYSTRIFVAR